MTDPIQIRVRMQVKTAPDHTADMKDLLLSLHRELPIRRKETKASKIAAQRRVEASEPKKPTVPYNPENWSGLSIQGAHCIYSAKGAKFRFSIDSNAPNFSCIIEELIFRRIPFKIYDILDSDEEHESHREPSMPEWEILRQYRPS